MSRQPPNSATPAHSQFARSQPLLASTGFSNPISFLPTPIFAIITQCLHKSTDDLNISHRRQRPRQTHPSPKTTTLIDRDNQPDQHNPKERKPNLQNEAQNRLPSRIWYQCGHLPTPCVSPRFAASPHQPNLNPTSPSPNHPQIITESKLTPPGNHRSPQTNPPPHPPLHPPLPRRPAPLAPRPRRPALL